MSEILPSKKRKLNYSEAIADPALHRLLRENAENRTGFKNNDKAIISIIERNPSAAKARDVNHFPLFVAIDKGASFEVLNTIYNAYPDAIKMRLYDSSFSPTIYRGGETLLHFACLKGLSEGVISFLLERWSGALQVKDNGGRRPLHAACMWGASKGVISLMLKHHPAAIKARDKSGMTPLHAACVGRASKEVISLLLERWPAAVRVTNNSGNTPLYDACDRGAPEEVISLLLKQWAAAVEVRHIFGQTPLHAACKIYVSKEVISLLIENCPAAVKVKDDNGMTPLHAAIDFKFPIKEVISLLLESWPEAVEIKNNFGRTPLDCLIGSNDDTVRVKNMLKGVHLLLKEKIHPRAMTNILSDFVSIEWLAGVRLAFDLQPDALRNLRNIPLRAIPNALSIMGCHCKLLMMWNILQNRQDILKVS